MLTSDSLNIGENGHLTFAGVDTLSLAERFGTPLYLFDEDAIRLNCRAYRAALDKTYHGNGGIAYASKAFSCLAAAHLMNEEGMYLDVVSGGELFTALKADFPAERILFHGNNKSEEELAFAIESDVGRIVADSVCELEKIDELGAEYGKIVKVLLRITPGIDAHTHEFIRTGQIDSKFGVTLENGDALAAVKAVLSMKNIFLAGLHCHIGSQLFDAEPFLLAAHVMVGFMDQIRTQCGVTLGELDLGGGFAIRYKETDEKVDYEAQLSRVTEAVKKECETFSYPRPFLFFEPGRSLVGEAGITLYTVGRIKEIPGVRTFVSVDGGMADNPRYALYHSDYEVCIADRANETRDFIATVAGKCCESGDLIQEHTAMQKPEIGDILAVCSTGAYHYSMSSNYNRLCKPPVVFVRNGVPRLVVRRETYDDLLRNDVAPLQENETVVK